MLIHCICSDRESVAKTRCSTLSVLTAFSTFVLNIIFTGDFKPSILACGVSVFDIANKPSPVVTYDFVVNFQHDHHELRSSCYSFSYNFVSLAQQEA